MKFSTGKHSECNRPVQGQALLELAIVIPFLIFFLFSVYDLGRIVNEYLVLSSIAYEGARLSSSVAGLEPHALHSDQNSTGEPPQMHRRIREKVYALMERTEFADRGFIIDTAHIRNDPSFGQEHTVTVVIQTTSSASFPMFRGLTLSAKATAPYLFPTRDVI